MPIHDWTRVAAGTWHDFHYAWIAEIRRALNGGLLPQGYFAQAEQFTGPFGPDLLTLQSRTAGEASAAGPDGGIAVADAPPRTRITSRAEIDEYAARQRTLVVRHVTGHRIVAFLEIASPGNKSSQHALNLLVEKAVEMIARGYHLLLVDLFPPTRRDPQGLHGAIWREFSEEPFALPPDEPLTLAAYAAQACPQAYVEPTAVGRELIDMPLFLDPGVYINVSLARTYDEVYRTFPAPFREILEAPNNPA